MFLNKDRKFEYIHQLLVKPQKRIIDLEFALENFREDKEVHCVVRKGKKGFNIFTSGKYCDEDIISNLNKLTKRRQEIKKDYPKFQKIKEIPKSCTILFNKNEYKLVLNAIKGLINKKEVKIIM
jgi:hypothetical protein